MDWYITLISLALVVGFILLDFIVHYYPIHLKKKKTLSSSEGKETEDKKYSPDFKIWGFGAILGAAYIFMHYLIVLLKTLIPFDRTVKWHEIVLHANKSTDWMLVILPLGILVSIIVVVGLFLHAVVKISTED